MTAAGVPAAPVADVADIVSAEQTQALGVLQTIDHDRDSRPPLPALPLSFDRERATHASAPPAVGEHTAEILEGVGYDNDEIASLAAAGVVRLATTD